MNLKVLADKILEDNLPVRLQVQLHKLYGEIFVENRKALVLFSGGLDSTTMLAMVKSDGYEITALTINYNQRHISEIDFSKKSLSQVTN